MRDINEGLGAGEQLGRDPKLIQSVVSREASWQRIWMTLLIGQSSWSAYERCGITVPSTRGARTPSCAAARIRAGGNVDVRRERPA